MQKSKTWSLVTRQMDGMFNTSMHMSEYGPDR